MSIQSEIDRLKTAKSEIADAIASKGVEVPLGSTLSAFPDLVNQIPTGGGLEPLIGTTETVTPAQVVEAVQNGRQVVVIKDIDPDDRLYFAAWSIEIFPDEESQVATSYTLSSNSVKDDISLLIISGDNILGWREPFAVSGQGFTPKVKSSDAGKFLRVDSHGKWAAEAVPSAEEVSF